MFGVRVPDAAGVRVMLSDLQEATGLPRGLLATLLCESQHAVRRWQDGSRSPGHAARWKIALVCNLVAGMDAFEVIQMMMEQANAVAADKSRSGLERLSALRSVPQLGVVQARLSRAVMALAEAHDAGEPVAA